VVARIICLASAKGGSGKTSLIATFATFLSKVGKNTLLIDSDFATNGLTLLFLKEVRVASELIRSTARPPAGLYDALTHTTKCDVVKLSDHLHLIPATFDLQAGLSSAGESVRLSFQDILRPLRDEYDFILIDAQAGADEMGQIAMSRKVSDEVVIVSEYDPMSAAGVERLKALLSEDLTYDRTWVLLNKILPEFAKSFSDFMEVAKYLSPIPWDASVVRAYARRRLAIDTETGNEHTISVLQTLKGLCGELIQPDLDNWVRSRAAAIRQPLEDQYFDAEKEMASVLSDRTRLERKERINRVGFITGIMIAAAIVVGYAPKAFGYEYSTNSYYVLVGVVAMAAFLGFMLTELTAISAFLGTGVQFQMDRYRHDRQLDVLRERLKRLEVLRALDPETLLGNPELRQAKSGSTATRYRISEVRKSE
jgi:MinD-like ATPase involved in chromosome partitioning or flagellar assembly